MKKNFIIICFLFLLIINLGIAKDVYILDFTKETPLGNLIYEISKGARIEREDSKFHLALIRPESFLKIYTPVTKELLPIKVILKLVVMNPYIPYIESFTPISILVNDKIVVRGWDLGSNSYISPSFDITSHWIKGETNKIEIKLDNDASGELWIRYIEITTYDR
jgi:hypothetical protein